MQMQMQVDSAYVQRSRRLTRRTFQLSLHAVPLEVASLLTTVRFDELVSIQAVKTTRFLPAQAMQTTTERIPGDGSSDTKHGPKPMSNRLSAKRRSSCDPCGILRAIASRGVSPLSLEPTNSMSSTVKRCAAPGVSTEKREAAGANLMAWGPSCHAVMQPYESLGCLPEVDTDMGPW